MLALLLLYYYSTTAKASLAKYIIPFYEFTKHDNWDYSQDQANETVFHEDFTAISLVHGVGSGVGCFVVSVTAPVALPFLIGYTGYHAT